MARADEVLIKIRKPPSLQNWVRLNHRRRDETARRIFAFALSKPRHALAKVYTIIADYVTFGISKETVNNSLQRITNPLVRRLGQEIVRALLPWLDQTAMKGIDVFHEFSIAYPIGRGILVPVKPTFVFLNEGRLTPVFVIGWASTPFNGFQQQLLCTIIQQAILTLEEFEGSDAHIVCVPRVKGAQSDRFIRHWKVNDVIPLTDDELREQFDRFGNALDDAVPMILEEMARRGEL